MGFPYTYRMKTVIETHEFQKQAKKIWTEDERLAFIDWISQNPYAGDVVPGADGARKVRWNITGKGKRGGARIIYFNIDHTCLLLIAIYRKSDKSSISAKQIEEVK